MKSVTKAYSILIGTIIGAGIFGIPYVVAKSGLLMGALFFITVGSISIILHLMYGEVVLSTQEKHRLPGFVKKYLGNKWGQFAKISSTLGNYGILAAYLILGGKFTFFLLGPLLGGTEFIYQLTYAFVFAIFIFLGINPIARIETFLTFSLIGLLAILVGGGFAHFDSSILPIMSESVQYAFLPYGVLLFSLFGVAAVPEMIDVLGNESKKLRKIIVRSIVICVGVTALFTISAIGIAGTKVSSEAINTFSNALGPWTLVLGSVIGFLAISTSILIIGLYLADQFKYDFKWKHGKSVLATTIPPIIILFITQDFILIMGFVGAIFVATEATFLAFVWKKAKTKGDLVSPYHLNIGNWVVWIIILVFIAGAIQEIFTLI